VSILEFPPGWSLGRPEHLHESVRDAVEILASLIYLGRHSEIDEDAAVLYLDIAEVQLRILANIAERMRSIDWTAVKQS
jgi:hypothetical protein